MTPRRTLRRYVEQLPWLATTFRQVRDGWALRQSVAADTPYGFKLAGNPSMAAGTFEPDEVALVMDRTRACDVFVDVGANVGLYSCLALSLGKHVVAVEPLRENLDYLFRNLESNGFSDVEVFPMGVGAEPSLVTIYGGQTGASLIAGWADATPTYRTTIPLTTLDTLLDGRFHNSKLVIKIDVEGAEDQVLEGGSRALVRRPQPTWLVEVCLTEHHPGGINPNFKKVFERFWSTGYHAFSVGPGRRRIDSQEVDSWVASRHCNLGHNYEFTAP